MVSTGLNSENLAFDNDMLKALASGGFGAAQRLSGLGVQGEGAAYTGPKFLHQMEEAALAALAGAAHASGTSVDQKALAGDKARAMDDLKAEITNCSDPAARVRLSKALERLMVAKTPDAIRAAIAAAESLAAADGAGSDSPETPAQKEARLWGEVSKLNEEIDKDFDSLDPWLKPEERKLRIADRKAVEEAEKERQRVFADPSATEDHRRKADQRLLQANATQAQHQEAMVARVEHDNPNNHEVATITAPLKTKIHERDEKLRETGATFASLFQPTPTQSTETTPAVADATHPRQTVTMAAASNVIFSGFVTPDSGSSQTVPNAKPKAPTTRQT